MEIASTALASALGANPAPASKEADLGFASKLDAQQPNQTQAPPGSESPPTATKLVEEGVAIQEPNAPSQKPDLPSQTSNSGDQDTSKDDGKLDATKEGLVAIAMVANLQSGAFATPAILPTIPTIPTVSAKRQATPVAQDSKVLTTPTVAPTSNTPVANAKVANFTAVVELPQVDPKLVQTPTVQATAQVQVQGQVQDNLIQRGDAKASKTAVAAQDIAGVTQVSNDPSAIKGANRKAPPSAGPKPGEVIPFGTKTVGTDGTIVAARSRSGAKATVEVQADAKPLDAADAVKNATVEMPQAPQDVAVQIVVPQQPAKTDFANVAKDASTVDTNSTTSVTTGKQVSVAPPASDNASLTATVQKQASASIVQTQQTQQISNTKVAEAAGQIKPIAEPVQTAKATAKSTSKTTSTTDVKAEKTDGDSKATVNDAPKVAEKQTANQSNLGSSLKDKAASDEAVVDDVEPTIDPKSVSIESAPKQVSVQTTDAPAKTELKPMDMQKTQQVINQVVDRLETLAATRPKDGVTIHLNPVDLGNITMTVKAVGHLVDAQIVTSNEQVRDALETNKPQLAAQMQARGFQLNNVTLDSRQTPQQNLGESAMRQTFEQQQQQQHQQQQKAAQSAANPFRLGNGSEAVVQADRKLSTKKATGVDLWI